MKISEKTILISSVKVFLLPTFLCLSHNSAYASLTNITQNQTFESRPQAAIYSKRPVSLTKLAAVHFITNDGQLNFGEQEFKPRDLCITAGYIIKECPTGHIAVDTCPDDPSYFKSCIDKSTWCQNNDYKFNSCKLPQYPSTPCPYDSTYYKSCETDNARACQELGYSLSCETGKISNSNDICPYDYRYKKCICNPCNGYDYTASEATEQGYTMGESCNSCGTLKYKRTANPCNGYLECSEGGASGASVCYSGTIKKFSECKQSCESCPYTDTGGSCPFDTQQYIYTGTTNCGISCYACCTTSKRENYGTGCSCVSDGDGGYTVSVGGYSEFYTNDVYERREDTSYTSYSFDTLSQCENSLSGLGPECSTGLKGSSSHTSCW